MIRRTVFVSTQGVLIGHQTTVPQPPDDPRPAGAARLHLVGDNTFHKPPVHSTPQVHTLRLQVSQPHVSSWASHNDIHQLAATCRPWAVAAKIQVTPIEPPSAECSLHRQTDAALHQSCTPDAHSSTCSMACGGRLGRTSRGMSRSLRRKGPRGQLSLL